MSNNQIEDTSPVQEQKQLGDFIFDEEVASMFDDMIRRSVPGYGSIINMIGMLAGEYAQPNSFCYDLGCSLGAGTLAMRRYIADENVKIISVDNSQAMIDRCRQNIVRSNLTVPVDIICQNVEDTAIEQASVVIINFTLQFIDVDYRQALISRIYEGLLPGGILLISEKIALEDPMDQICQTLLHQSFKKVNGYSNLNIAQKRTALDEMLIEDTIETHRVRLEDAGFQRSHVWFRCFNFASLIAYK